MVWNIRLFVDDRLFFMYMLRFLVSLAIRQHFVNTTWIVAACLNDIVLYIPRKLIGRWTSESGMQLEVIGYVAGVDIGVAALGVDDCYIRILKNGFNILIPALCSWIWNVFTYKVHRIVYRRFEIVLDKESSSRWLKMLRNAANQSEPAK